MRGVLTYCLGWVLVCIGASGLGLLVWEIGWPLSGNQLQTVGVAMRAVVTGFIVCALLQWALAEHRKAFFRAHRAMLLIVACSIAALLLDHYLSGWLGTYFTEQVITRILLVYISVTQLLILAGVGLHALPALERHVFVRMSPGILLIVTFLLLILIGTCLLRLPNATVPGGELSWLDALFTATSAVCVTGLIVVDTATEFTRTGQAIILVLFQVGGLGIMTLTYFLAVLAGEGLSVRNRVHLSELMSEDRIASLGSLLAMILSITLVAELIGALALLAIWSGGSGWPVLWFDALFHSVSAFCNAGFSTFSAGLADPLTARSVPTHGIICGLIILGGLGFPVLRGLGACWWGRIRDPRRQDSVRGLNTHCRLVLTTTALLLFLGTVLGFFTASGAQQGEGFWMRLDVAFFNSVTARTAGFNIMDFGELLPAGALMIMMLMFIGGSPGSMAGGIKTSTFAVAMLNIGRLLRNRRDIEVFRRRLPAELMEQAFAGVLLGLLWVFSTSFMLLWFEPQLAPLDAFFEVFSAFGTVGLSRGITSSLSEPGKALLVLTMFVGRIGILTFTLALFRSREHSTPIRLPSDTVILG